MAKNLPSSLRLFSFLAAIKRSGPAATSSKRCSMAPGARGSFALRAPESRRGSGTGAADNYAPRGRAAAAAPHAPGKRPHTWGGGGGEHAARAASSLRDAPGHQEGPPPRPRKRPAASLLRRLQEGMPASRVGVFDPVPGPSDGKWGDDALWDKETEDSAKMEKRGRPLRA